MNVLQQVFSVKNEKSHKILRVFGIKFKFKYDSNYKTYMKFKKTLFDVPNFDTIHMELSNLCGYKCKICPHTAMTRQIGYMQDKDIEIIAKRIKNCDNIKQIDLHGFGEPLLIKDLFHKASVTKKYFKNATLCIISTLGYEMSDDFFENLVNSDISKMEVSFYGYTRENYKAIHGVDKYDIAYKNLLKLVEINNKYNNKLNLTVSIYENDYLPSQNLELKDNLKHLVGFKKKLELCGHNPDKYYSIKLHNFGMGKNYTKQSKFPCSIAYGSAKKVLQISWNLNVIPCCLVYDDEIVFGNLKKQSLNKIFGTKYYKKFVENHMKNNISQYVSCKTCTKLWDSNPDVLAQVKYYLEKL